MRDSSLGNSIAQDRLASYLDSFYEYRRALHQAPRLAHHRTRLAVQPEFPFDQALAFLARRDEEDIDRGVARLLRAPIAKPVIRGTDRDGRGGNAGSPHIS